MTARWSLLLAALLTMATGPADASPLFKERAADLGITHQYLGDWTHFVGGGIAAFDCDGDHLPELFAAGGTAEAVLLRNRSEPGGDLVFVPETPPSLRLTGVTGAYPLDIDSDGHMDLVIPRVGTNLLMRGGPDCRFSPFPADLDFQSGDRWTTAFSASWEKGATLPTLAFGNYVDLNDPKGPFEACDVNTLHRPQGMQYGDPTVLAPGFCALSILFSDWGRRGRADLRMSNDRHYYIRGGSEQMWAMEATPRLYTAAEGWQPYPLWGMGIASRDVTGDGLPDVYLTSMGDQRLQYLTSGERPEFLDAPYEAGTTAHRPFIGDEGRPSTGWHAEFGDVNNDGLDDLFVAKGNVEQMPSNAIEDPNNLLMQQADGTFQEAADKAGIASIARSRGAVVADLNLDGRLDIAVVNRRSALEIHQNITPDTGGWLLLKLQQDPPNIDGVGAWVDVQANGKTQTREITVGGGHVSGSSGATHFGLGIASAAKLRVTWPDGQNSDWIVLDADQRLLLTRDGSNLRQSSFP